MPPADPLARFLRDPHRFPQEAVDRLIATAHRFDDAPLESFNVTLAARHGFDPADLAETSRLIDEPPLPPIEL